MSLGGTDLNLLTALKVLLEEVNVTHAGRRLNMSQPTMSGALARLRRQFNDELLVRSGREYELTPFAADLLPSVQEAVHLLNVAFQLEAPFDPMSSGRTFRLTMSDYALSVLHGPLSARVHALAPGVRLEFTELGLDARGSDRIILDHDVMVGPLGYGFPGVSRPLFRDRMVCLMDRFNPALKGGGLTLDAFGELPHAVATFGRRNLTPADRVLDELGLTYRTQVSVSGWLALPFVITGTTMVAVVPERLARRFAGNTDLVSVDAPFGDVDLIEGYWYQPAKAHEAGHSWLLSVFHDIAAELGSDEARA